uniref:Uncharacterized protein n=1 Tax=Anguilla anguilla TaxID=7936 RepID=A0A0E9VT42_ANGAN
MGVIVTYDYILFLAVHNEHKLQLITTSLSLVPFFPF